MPIDIDFVNRLGIDILQVSGIDMGYSEKGAFMHMRYKIHEEVYFQVET